MHRRWLGSIYRWAGDYRQVNLEKGGFPFAAAAQVPRLMGIFAEEVLSAHTPLSGRKDAEIIRGLAVVHTELILIHPFREGNGRLARMLAVLMALQAELPPLDFGGIRGQRKEAYFAAVRAGIDQNYKPMESIFEKVIRRTVRKATFPRRAS